MKILVAVKRVIDYNAKIRVKVDQSGVETQNVKMSMNPFDEIAVEEAVRLKEKNIANEVVVVSIGEQACQEILRAALALGADSAILCKTDKVHEPLAIAKILKKLIEQYNFDLVILGKQAIDGDNNQTAQMLAGLLNWPQATFASKIEIQNSTAEVTREVDGGLEILNVDLPAVISTDLRLNEPRYASLPNIMKAKKKPLEIVAVTDLGLSLKTRLHTKAVMPPKERKAGIKVGSVAELVSKLKTEAKVI